MFFNVPVDLLLQLTYCWLLLPLLLVSPPGCELVQGWSPAGPWCRNVTLGHHTRTRWGGGRGGRGPPSYSTHCQV